MLHHDVETIDLNKDRNREMCNGLESVENVKMIGQQTTIR